MDDSKGIRTVIRRVVDTAFVPLYAATSKNAQKAYLGTFLFATASILLFGISSVAYFLFYYNYVPQVSVERLIHLQFGSGSPYGIATLDSSLTFFQDYDVSLFLHLPRTPNNIAAGNFMLDLSLLGPETTTSTSNIISSAVPGKTSTSVLARSRRPAIMTYTSSMIDTASKFGGLPWYVIGWKTESEVLEVSMFEGVVFSKGRNSVPQSVKVTVEADEKMQFYEVGIRVIARFGGLRWILYHHRILSCIFFTTTFWSSSMFTMLLAWFFLSSYAASPSPAQDESDPDTDDRLVKTERSDSENFDPLSDEDLSDTSRTFPTLSGQMPLHFSRRRGVKKEEVEEVKREEDDVVRSTHIQPLIAEADAEGDDESPEASNWRDSGLGTGLDEERLASVQRRRKGLMSGRGEG